ncbi:MAG: energy-coupling factor transporter ATPase [Clostridiales bacterium]|nr:energy-coupling factor transporter ATPase [Clostridiales bacterium]
MTAKIEVKNVSYIYSPNTPFQKEAISQVNCAFEAGVITGLIGHTGSGKSTLVQLLNGLLKPSTGEVLLDGVNIWAEPKKIKNVRFRVGLVFQYPEYQLFEETVFDDIAYAPKNMGLSAEEISERVHASARMVGLREELMQKSPFDLSGGQKRRVAIAGILAMEPEVLILDEPAAGLDPIGRKMIFETILQYQAQKKATVIIVSHSMEDMAEYAQQIVVMKGSHILMQDTPKAIFKKAELLTEAGLDVPQITRMMMRLQALGGGNRTDIFTVQAARDELLRLMGKEGGPVA